MFFGFINLMFIGVRWDVFMWCRLFIVTVLYFILFYFILFYFLYYIFTISLYCISLCSTFNFVTALCVVYLCFVLYCFYFVCQSTTCFIFSIFIFFIDWEIRYFSVSNWYSVNSKVMYHSFLLSYCCSGHWSWAKKAVFYFLLVIFQYFSFSN